MSPLHSDYSSHGRGFSGKSSQAKSRPVFREPQALAVGLSDHTLALNATDWVKTPKFHPLCEARKHIRMQ